MLKRIALLTAVVCASAAAWADARDDCENKSGEIAIKGCTELILRNPRDAAAYANRGLEYSKNGDHDRAIADYTKAIELAPKEGGVFYNRGKEHYEKGDFNRAIADFTKAIQLGFREARVYTMRGDAYAGKKDYDLAIADYTKAINVDPKFGPAYWLRGALLSKEKNELDRAIADYNKAIELDPKDAQAYNGRGNVYIAKGDYDRAIADYTKAIDLDSKNLTFLLNVGFAKFYKGDFKGAAADLLRVLALQDDIYPMLVRYLARSHAGENATSELEANASRLKTKEWPYAVIELYLGRRQPDATLAATSNPDEKCEAHFYIGEWHVLRKDHAEAAKALRIAVDTCPKTFIEYKAAVAELKRLNP